MKFSFRRAVAEAKLAMRPRTRLSSTRISPAPASMRRSTICEPIRPAPPVTSTVDPSSEIDISGNLQSFFQGVDHGVLLGGGHLGKQRQRQALASNPLGHGEIPFAVAQVLICLLQVQRDRVVQAGVDAD